ncbi:MAG: flagellar hook-basal body complex protein FliE [Pseudomonadota bacterium]
MEDLGISDVLSQIRQIKSEMMLPNSFASSEESANINSKNVSPMSSFSEVLSKSLSEVNELQKHSTTLKNRFEMGDQNVSLSDVMIASQKASIGFEAVIQVRNKIVDAYKEIMNMPI